MMINKETDMTFQFTVLANDTFDFTMLPRFSSEHGVSATVIPAGSSIQHPSDDWTDNPLIRFESDNLDRLEEVFDQFTFLNPSDILKK
jgi:hypothetical protein